MSPDNLDPAFHCKVIKFPFIVFMINALMVCLGSFVGSLAQVSFYNSTGLCGRERNQDT
jgi:hypothetical protein